MTLDEKEDVDLIDALVYELSFDLTERVESSVVRMVCQMIGSSDATFEHKEQACHCLVNVLAVKPHLGPRVIKAVPNLVQVLRQMLMENEQLDVVRNV